MLHHGVKAFYSLISVLGANTQEPTRGTPRRRVGNFTIGSLSH